MSMNFSIFDGGDGGMGYIWRNARQSRNVVDLRGRYVRQQYSGTIRWDSMWYFAASIPRVLADGLTRQGMYVYSVEANPLGNGWYTFTADVAISAALNGYWGFIELFERSLYGKARTRRQVYGQDGAGRQR